MSVATAACGQVQVRDYGLLESALARSAATVFGSDAYPTAHGKAAVLLHSLACNHALVNGKKRLAWMACAVFLWINGQDLDPSEDTAFDLVVSVAQIKERNGAAGVSVHSWIIAAIEHENFRQLCRETNEWWAQHPEAAERHVVEHHQREDLRASRAGDRDPSAV
ncbi:MAG: type II toxin-antitoxin system death-on-curing family toxin [Pseudonocardiaceae bacterium]